MVLFFLFCCFLFGFFFTIFSEGIVFYFGRGIVLFLGCFHFD